MNQYHKKANISSDKHNLAPASSPHFSLVEKATTYIITLMQRELSPKLTFHNLEHTKEVATAAEQIADFEQLDFKDKSTILLAAWFHDIGQIICYRGHELSSQHIARHFLSSQNCSAHQINQILDCISATRMPQRPTNLLEKIMCDSDLSHLAATPDVYLEHLQRLRLEWEKVLGQKEKDEDWILLNVEFLTQHTYFTNYGKKFLEPRKQQNIDRLLGMLG